MIDGIDARKSPILPSNVALPEQSVECAEASDSPLADTSALMLRELHSWGLWQTGLGVVHLVGGGFLNAPWGVLLIVVGLASFSFRSAAMFIVYPTTLVWAAFSNMTGGSTGWVGFGLIQLYFAFRTVRAFSGFLRAERAIAAEAHADGKVWRVRRVGMRSRTGPPGFSRSYQDSSAASL
jgi:hypothetical protein